MEKKSIIGISILIGITLLLMVILFNKKDNNYYIYNNSGSELAFYYQDDSGEYTKSTDAKWIEGGYTLNIAESSCNGQKNPSNLSWNEKDRMVVLKSSKATSCTLYFDKKTMLDVLLQVPAGDEGELLEHTPELLNSAGDGGYRYSGNNPNNYICFGKGSEKYNNGTPGAECNVKNKYRIIGYVPVTLADGSSTSLIKVIKAEYLTEDEFGTKAGTASVDSTYDSIKRIESSQSGIPTYKWNGTAINNWKESTLYTSLNSDDSNGYKDKAFGDTWLNKIENVRWNVGGISDSDLTAKAIYEEEMKGQGKTATVDAQIGLMYAHDYGFASEKNSWSSTLYDYDNTGNENIENNWLFNGVNEWTISRVSSGSGSACFVDDSGYVCYGNYVYNAYVAVRPVFYLKSNVKIVGGEGADGSQASPLKVE